MAWMEDGDLNETWVGGSISMWAFAALISAIIWQLLVKARSVYANPEIRKKISAKIQRAMDERDNN